NSPYSATKAGSDFLVRSYFHTFGLNVVTTNCSNNYGPAQHHEKLIPTVVRKALAGEKIPIYGNGLNIRDWLYVDDHCKALTAVFERGQTGETYNIGSRNELTNIEIANEICAILNDMVPSNIDYRSLISFVKDRPGHDSRYAIDPTKMETQLGWRPEETFASGLVKTLKWYVNQEQRHDNA
ncbi:MAG: NAD-dependent epimerase/dehydratase family protein, partial [Proteobacteria bacterium]